VNPSSVPWTARIVSAQVAGDGSGRVVAVEAGLVLVTRRGLMVRATIGGDLLARLAADPAAGPRAGDRVLLRCWADGRVTVEQVLARGLPGTGR
jgi:hypothetical protein